MKMNKLFKKGGVAGELISGTGGLVITVIITLVIVSTLMGASLLSGAYQGAAGNMTANFTSGIDLVSGKVPTILLIGAVVLLFGVLVLLVRQASLMGIGGGARGSL